MKHISSRDNPRIKELIALCTSARDRKKQQLSVLEGLHLVEMGLAVPALEVHTTAVSHGALSDPQIQNLLEQMHALDDVIVLPDSLFRSISQLAQGASILQIVHTPHGDLDRAQVGDVVFLEGIQDPGNLGSILRTCVAAGIGHVVTNPSSADSWSPKALRAGMGAQLALNLIEGISFDQLRQHIKLPAMATALSGEPNLYQQQLIEPHLWCFGNEGQGLTPDVVNAVGVTCVQIPQAHGVESLNVAAAAAVCLFEQVRQRSM